MTVEEWIEAYRRSWEERNADAAAALFSEDAEYRTHPFLDPNLGRDGVRSYWTDVTSTQANVAVRLGRPFRDADRVAVEFWTTMGTAAPEVRSQGALLRGSGGNGR